MPKIRVLVVDDAVVVRRILTDVLEADPDIEVVGTAPNGRIALAKITQVNPDIITLDVDMPEMDGLSTLRALRANGHKQPVIMFSTLTEKAATTTLDALAAGASDYVTKPANVGSVVEAKQQVHEQLIPKIKALSPGPFRAPALPPPPRPLTTPGGQVAGVAHRPRPGARIDCVAIGVSTGGPNALTTLFRQLPADFPAPIVIVQHMPPVFTRQLAARLSAVSTLTVTEGEPGMALAAGRAAMAPGDQHMEVARHGANVLVRLHKGPPENSCRPAADVLFRSVAAIYGANALAVVLTGMGYDGLRGVQHIRERGGAVIAQDRATSIVWGMPGAVAEAGLADTVLPLDRVSDELVRRVGVGRRARVS
jgi:two-component system, chemotaxis family, protein-glutamate methylesterase/glutaminase